MAKFKSKKSNIRPEISTASLPDIIFMLLFFFMVVTVLRKDMLVNIQLPSASEVQKLEHRSLVNHIYIGQSKPISDQAINRIQINDAFVNKDQVEVAIRQLVAQKPENLHSRLTTSLQIDKAVQMGLITDVKTQLRKANQLKVNYAAYVGGGR